MQNSVSISESYSWRDSRYVELGRGGNWKLGLGIVTGIPWPPVVRYEVILGGRSRKLGEEQVEDRAFAVAVSL